MPKKGKAGLAVIVFIMILIIACILCFVVKQSKNKEDSEGNNGITASEVENEKKFDVAVQYDEEDTNTTTDGDKLVFDNSSVTSDSDNVTIDGTTAIITSGGTYVLSGKCSDGKVIISTQEDDVVHLVLDNIELSSKDSAAINELVGAKVVITLTKDSVNSLSDGSNYQSGSENDDTIPTACIYTKGSLTINGEGSLLVTGNCSNAIKTKDDFKMMSGQLTINSKTNGIVGKDSVAIKDGTLNVTSDKDGIKSNNTKDSQKGYILIEGGNITIIANDNGISANTCLKITDGSFDITSQNKSIKAEVDITIADGTYKLNSSDDGLHSNGSLTVEKGELTIDAKDDGIHAAGQLIVNDGTVNINNSSEGIEGQYIIINSGDISIVSTDDGMNATDSSVSEQNASDTKSDISKADISTQGEMMDSKADGSNQDKTEDSNNDTDNNGMQRGEKRGEGKGGGQGGFAGKSSDCSITINGGNITVNAAGDGIDSNGDIYVNGGIIYVNGPTNNGNGALDCGDNNNRIVVTGGTLLAIGSSEMAEFPSSDSTQYILGFTPEQQDSNTVIKIKDSKDNVIFDYTSLKTFSSICFSSDKLKENETYTLYLNDEKIESLTVNDIVSLGENTKSSGSMMQRGNGGFGKNDGKMVIGSRKKDRAQNLRKDQAQNRRKIYRKNQVIIQYNIDINSLIIII